ncbi:hypothetical protein HAX54_037865, partial [Datura stramonium]|nr:hypothetical protein [Datura stramonium]
KSIGEPPHHYSPSATRTTTIIKSLSFPSYLLKLSLHPSQSSQLISLPFYLKFEGDHIAPLSFSKSSPQNFLPHPPVNQNHHYSWGKQLHEDCKLGEPEPPHAHSGIHNYTIDLGTRERNAATKTPQHLHQPN